MSPDPAPGSAQSEPNANPSEQSPAGGAPVVPPPAPTVEESCYAGLISGIGYVLAASYPVLALSTGARAGYQIFFKEGVVVFHLPSLLSLLAALIYLVAAFGFAYRRRWTWWMSLGALSVEAVLVILVGTWSLVDPETVGRTVWRHYGEDYGYFPLIQPLIGLLWLLWPGTRRLYQAKG